jgi:DNA-binding FrmR family transcriptional regulator
MIRMACSNNGRRGESIPMTHTIQNGKSLLTRVRRITGQSQALEAALISQTECQQILQQLAAIRGAVNGLMVEVLEGHLREHVLAPDTTPEQRETDLDAVTRVLRSYLK